MWHLRMFWCSRVSGRDVTHRPRSWMPTSRTTRRLSISCRKLICRNPGETRRINTPFPLNVPVMQPRYISLVCHALGPTATTLSRTRLISPRTNRVTLRKKQRTGGERPGTGGPRRAGSLFRSNYWLKVRRGSLERSFTREKNWLTNSGRFPSAFRPLSSIVSCGWLVNCASRICSR